MPLDISSMQVVGGQPNAAVQQYSPKFFSDKLTGRGGKTPGILSLSNSPLCVSPNLNTQPNDSETRLYRFHQNSTDVTHLPMAPLHTAAAKFMTRVERPDFSRMFKVAEDKNRELWLDMEVQAVTIEDTEIPGDPALNIKRRTDHAYRISYAANWYLVADKNKTEHELDPYPILSMRPGYNRYWTMYTSNPIADICVDYAQQLLAAAWIVDQAGVKQFLTSYDVYDTASRRSETWQTSMDNVMAAFIDNIKSVYATDPDAPRALRKQIKYLMSYNIPLDQYRTIYKDIRATFSSDESNDICKQNLNLLLSDTMDKMSAVKPSIPGFAPPANPVAPPAHLSPQQLAAVSCQDPLILVQSGAGTGKSTMILGRIDHMVANGVDPKDIMVLSFTNAAADHILEKNPRLKSMTIAKMIHTIYELNFPGHELSETATLENTLDIYFPKQLGQTRGVVDDFQRYLRSIRKNDPSAYTDMNNFIEANYDEVIAILDTVHQTTLDLEIIICYQRIDFLTEPANITSKYLIIDEVQDNSVFEFIYVLRYITKHKEPLFMVGKLRLPTLNPTNCGKATHA